MLHLQGLHCCCGEEGLDDESSESLWPTISGPLSNAVSHNACRIQVQLILAAEDPSGRYWEDIGTTGREALEAVRSLRDSPEMMNVSEAPRCTCVGKVTPSSTLMMAVKAPVSSLTRSGLRLHPGSCGTCSHTFKSADARPPKELKAVKAPSIEGTMRAGGRTGASKKL